MKKEYNWTTEVAPLFGIPMYDNDGEEGDLPIEFHPRDSFDKELQKLMKLVSENHNQYHLSMIESPTEIQRKDINRLTELLEGRLKHIFFNRTDSNSVYDSEEINILQKKAFSYHTILDTQENHPDAKKYLKKYDAQFKVIDRPLSSNYIGDIDFFAYQYVAGNNPLALKRITSIPDNFPITETHYENVMEIITGEKDDIDSALEEKRLYMIDFSNLDGVTTEEEGVYKPEEKDSDNEIIGYSYQAMALFAVSKEDGLLKPVAIQCGQDPSTNPMILSVDGWTWERARLVLQAANKTEHQLYRHLGIAHLMGEVFALATYRNFEKNHPLYRLLISHMEGTNRINHNATIALLGEQQFVDLLMADELTNLAEKTVEMRLEHDFYDNFFPTDLKNRGVDDVEAFPVYPYRDDGLLIWNAINDWVSSYIRVVYSSDAAIKSDSQLQAWMTDIVENGKIKGFRVVETRTELIDILTMVIFSASAYHAAVNFPQKTHMMYSPYSVGYLSYEKPDKPVPDYTSEKKWVATLPTLIRSMYKIDIYTLLATIHNGYLGEYVDRDLKPIFSENDGFIYTHLQQFRNRLDEVEEIIAKRNKTRPYSYDILMPKNIPASVNI